jgi:hypothetical protein
MAEDLHAYYQRKSDERAQNRQDLAAAAAKNAAVEAPVTPTRSFGFTSGAGAPQEEVGRTASLVQAGAELGSPTSFNAGAGAPVPVEVVRGMKTTYTNPAPDMGAGGGYNPSLSRNTREFASPVQAGQAFNRGELNQNLALAAKTPGVTPNMEALTGKYGEYVPPEGPKIAAEGEQRRLAAAAELRSPEKVAAGEAIRAAEADRIGGLHVSTLKNYLATAYPGYDKNETMALDAKASEEVARQIGAPAAKTHFQERQAIRSYLKAAPNLPNNFDVNAYMGAVSQDPAAWKELVSRGRALKVTTPPEPQVPIGRRLWETPTPYGVSGP